MKIIIVLLIGILAYSKNVLILNSYSVQFPWTKMEVEGILKNLRTQKNLKIYIEFMDTKLFIPTKQYLDNFYNYLQTKYKNVNFDIVITTDDNALKFIISHKNDIFKKSKVFFAGVNDFSVYKQIEKNRFTGVFEKKEPITNLNLLKKTVKNLKYVYVIGDNSNSANSVMKEYKKAFENIYNIKFIYLNNRNLEFILSQIKHKKNSGILLLTPFSFYLNSKHINYKEAIKLLSDKFFIPIVIHTDILISVPHSNIIGGKVTDAFSQGDIISNKVLLYLNGKKIKNIPYTFEKANKLYLNVKNLQKFGINGKELGYTDAIYINNPDENLKYKKYLIISLAVAIILFMFILMLIFKNYKLIKYNNKIEILSNTLEESIKKRFEEFSNNNFNKISEKTEALKGFFTYILSSAVHNQNIPIQMESFYDKLFNEEKVFFKKNIHEMIFLLQSLKIINNIEVKGDDFIIEIDKIIFFNLFVLLIKENTKIISFKNKKVIFEYANLPQDIWEIIKKIKEKININAEINDNKLILSFN